MGRPKKKSCKVPVNSVKTRNIGKSPPDVHSVISSSESETEEIDRGLKAVRTVRDRQERNRRLDACDVLQRKVDEQCRALINSTHQVRAAISDPANTTLCRITREMNNVINLVPSIHRATSMLHRVKYKSEETPYTLYDMGQDGRYRRVSVDGEVSNLNFIGCMLLEGLGRIYTFSCRPIQSKKTTDMWTRTGTMSKPSGDIMTSSSNTDGVKN